MRVVQYDGSYNQPSTERGVREERESTTTRKHAWDNSSKSPLLPGGSATGFITALVGTGGALRATLLQGFNIEKVKYIATAATIALATDVTRIPVYISQGFLTDQYYLYLPVLFGMALAG